jgi:hypothetical protein
MTYYELLSNLKKIALRQANVNFAGSKDLYELNSLPDIDYNVFYITPNEFRLNEDTIEYSLNLFFISRWDETQENQNMIHSEGITVLNNIINTFDKEYPEAALLRPGLFRVFYQRFKDVCAGVYLTITFELPLNGLCVEEYE